jgi:hypothetical protein
MLLMAALSEGLKREVLLKDEELTGVEKSVRLLVG